MSQPVPSLLKYLDISWALQEAEKELVLAEKAAKEAPPMPKVDIVYFHDVGASLHNAVQTAEQARGHVRSLKHLKKETLQSIMKEIGLAFEGDNAIAIDSNQIGISGSKIQFSSYIEIVEAIAAELFDIYVGKDPLKLFVHDRLSPNEPPLHFTSWEQRFQQRMAQARDRVGKAKQGIVDIVNSASLNFKQQPLVKDINHWTTFVSSIDATFATILVQLINVALENYARQLQGRNVRELFAVNLKLSQTCEPILVPTPQDVMGKLSLLFRQTLFSICPDNAVAHVISTPTNTTKDNNISPKKICVEHPQLANSLTILDSLTQEVCEGLTSTSAKIRKQWESYWGPAMAVAGGTKLHEALTSIQSQFVFSHSICNGAVSLNAFPLQDALISMLHVQIENAKDNEIKALVGIWTKAVEKGSSPVALSTIAESPVPIKAISSTINFDPMAFVKTKIAEIKEDQPVNVTRLTKSVASTEPTATLSLNRIQDDTLPVKSVERIKSVEKSKVYTTMTVEVVSDTLAETSTRKENEVISQPVTSVLPSTQLTPRGVEMSDSASEFRRRVEMANTATAAAAKRKEELRLSPRSPSQRLASLQGVTNPLREIPQPQVPSTANRDPRPALSPLPSTSAREPTIQSTDNGALKSIIKNSTPCSYQPPATAPTDSTRPSRAVEFEPSTKSEVSTAAFKKASAPPEDDDETILRKLMQKEKESMERIQQIKEKDKQRRMELAAAHRREIAGIEQPSINAIQPTVPTKSLPPLTSGDQHAKESEIRIQEAIAKENEKIRQLRESTELHPQSLKSPTDNNEANHSRPESALRRKLSLPQGSTTNTSVVNHQPSPPPVAQQPVALNSIRKPQTAPLSVGTPRGVTNLPTLSPSEMNNLSLLDIYRNHCSQSGIKPNSGLLKMLPKTVGENITKINLDLNYIGVKGFQPLLQILKVNRGLTFLNLKDNNLENNEVRALVTVLCTESGDLLRHLDLSNNPISLAGGTALLDLIEKQRNLSSVVVSGTLIQPKIVEKLNDALAKKQ